MIKCKPYRAKFLQPTTCITKQKELQRILPWVQERRRKGRKHGNLELLESSFPNAYYDVIGCDGCKIGEKLFRESQKGKAA